MEINLNSWWLRLIASILIIAVSFVLRNYPVKLLVQLSKKCFKRIAGYEKFTELAIESPTRFLTVAMGFWCAALILEMPSVIKETFDRVLHSLVLFSIFRAAYKSSDMFSAIIEKLFVRSRVKFDSMLALFIRKSFKVAIVLAGTVTIIQEWYDNIGGIVAGLGLGGLAFALAAKDTVANLFGSLTIMADRPFNIGDWIATAQLEGTVEEIGFRSTRIRTASQAVITVPNSIMSNEAITNWSRMGKRRVAFKLSLKHGISGQRIKCLKAGILGIIQASPEVEGSSAVAALEGFGESSLELQVNYFIKTTEWVEFLKIREDIFLSVMDKIEELDIDIALPSRSVYLETGGRDKLKA